jgi:hypothetical protein
MNGDEDRRKDVVRNRENVNVIFLLELYIIAISMKTNQKAKFETGCNLPVILLALDDVEDIFVEQMEFDTMRNELEKEPNSFASRIQQLTEKFRSNYREFTSPYIRNPHRALKLKQTILSRLHEEAKELASIAFYRLNEIIHLSNTRCPRIITMREAVEFDSIKWWMRNIFQLLPDGEGERLQREFLARSSLVGTERGLPVVPTDKRFYILSRLNMEHLDDLITQSGIIKVSEAERQERRWNPHAPHDPLPAVAAVLEESGKKRRKKKKSAAKTSTPDEDKDDEEPSGAKTSTPHEVEHDEEPSEPHVVDPEVQRMIEMNLEDSLQGCFEKHSYGCQADMDDAKSIVLAVKLRDMEVAAAKSTCIDVEQEDIEAPEPSEPAAKTSARGAATS